MKGWIKQWNNQMFVSEEQVPQEFLTKKVRTVCTPVRRTLLEVFKFLAAREIDDLAAPTCKEWFHVSRDEEMWKSKFIQEFNPAETQADASYRKKYITIGLNSCIHCWNPVTLGEIYWKCPLRGRLLCMTCHAEADCNLIPVNHYMKQRNISPSLTKLVKSITFKVKGVEVAYYLDLAKVFVPYAERKKAQLIEYLESRHLGELSQQSMAELRAADLSKLYGHRFVASQLLMALSTFIGRDERMHSFEVTAEASFY